MQEILTALTSPAAWIALVTLVILEIVLGIDNIVFLSIMTGKLPQSQQPKARTIGLSLAMVARIALLFCISLLMRLTKPFFTYDTDTVHVAVTGQSIIILIGGLFLLYKSVTEINDKIEAHDEGRKSLKSNAFAMIILQVVALDIVFSLDSVLTAVGMVGFKDFGYIGSLFIMALAIVIAVIIMLFFSGPVSNFVNKHLSIQMLALAFLILIGATLLVEAAHLANLEIFGRKVEQIPKGYVYVAIFFSLLVEVLNLRARKKHLEREKAAARDGNIPPGWNYDE